MAPVHIVWFKRDLRLHDHAPLVHAAARRSVMPLYVFEPEFWKQPEWDQTHFEFVCQSLKELHGALHQIGLQLHCRVGEVVDVLADIHRRISIASVHSHEETGGRWTFQRDRRVGDWLRANGIEWREYPQNGVVRGLRNRDGWASHWKQWMQRPQSGPPEQAIGVEGKTSLHLPDKEELLIQSAPDTRSQSGGESNAHHLLDSFLENRGMLYRTGMSSPITAESHCSRLSPYLAWGCITIKQVYQAAVAKRQSIEEAANRSSAERAMVQGLASFQSRLSWHCHFMQKLDDEPELEHRNLCRVYDGMREDHFRIALFDRWCAGQTGYPMIDACMRYLHRHRWINFRMRAMLMSFAAYHLWLHWREPALFLARHFLDFEPGIHFPQVQMQSGTTGINTVRIYSPVKQAIDHDPDGEFVRRWVPELEGLPKPWIFEPWKMSNDDQIRYGCRMGVDYPLPAVDHRIAVAEAKQRIYALRQTDRAKEDAEQVYAKHGSRKNRDPLPLNNSKTRNAATQMWLPGMEQDGSA